MRPDKRKLKRGLIEAIHMKDHFNTENAAEKYDSSFTEEEVLNRLSEAATEFLENGHDVEEIEDLFENDMTTLNGLENWEEFENVTYDNRISIDEKIRMYLRASAISGKTEPADLAVTKLKRFLTYSLTHGVKWKDIKDYYRELKRVNEIHEGRYDEMVSKMEECRDRLSEFEVKAAREVYEKYFS